jgi:hypothetical protein
MKEAIEPTIVFGIAGAVRANGRCAGRKAVDGSLVACSFRLEMRAQNRKRRAPVHFKNKRHEKVTVDAKNEECLDPHQSQD